MAAIRGWVSQSEAARREGVSQQWISQLVKQKRLETNAKRQVRLAQVRAVRAQELDPSRGKHKPQKAHRAAGSASPDQAPELFERSSGFTAARTKREQQQALLAEIEVRERLGQLVEWSKVEALNASTAVMIREALLAIPDRLAAVLAAETDEARIRGMIDNEIRTALEFLATALNKPV